MVTNVDLGGNNVAVGKAYGQAAPYPYPGFIFRSTSTITSSTTHTQAGATPITTQYVNVVNANAADAVLLPPAVAGAEVVVQNAGAAVALQVYATGTDTINGTAGSTGVSLAAASTGIYFCVVTGAWIK